MELKDLTSSVIQFQEKILNFDPEFWNVEKVELTMPKFSIDFSEDMKELMKDFGIETIFSPEMDLSPIFGEMKNKDIEIGGINHKVKFDVDENGIEGAAVTDVVAYDCLEDIST